MRGSDFLATYAKKGLPAWEAAALSLARQGLLTPWPMVDLPLSDGTNTAVLKVASDVLAVGPLDDYVRLPLTPSVAQSIANLSGSLLPTPWLEYQIWRAASLKLRPVSVVPNFGANLLQYADHSLIVDRQMREANAPPGTLVSGHKKGVVVANFYKPGKVLLFGWYRAVLFDGAGKVTGPAPDVFDDGLQMGVPNRQPIQPKSNIHDASYLDYSHGIRLIGPVAIVNGQPMETVSLYQHPTLSRLVSNEGPVKVPRYPSPIPPAVPRGVPVTSSALVRYDIPRGVLTMPSIMEYSLDQLARQRIERRR